MATVNPWKRFISLLPGGSRVIGTVTHVSEATGTTTVTLRNGSEMVAMGVGVDIGSKCFIKDGQVTGPAPDLPQYDVEV